MKSSSLPAALGLVACLLGAWVMARAGLARFSAESATAAALLPTADRAVRLNPFDAEAHRARALVLSRAGAFDEAAQAFGRATKLRPRDYRLWLELGRTREQSGDAGGALAAFRAAVERAPFYAQPRWELGSFWLRAGEDREAFDQFRRAAASDPALLSGAIDLAWQTYGGDAERVQAALRPRTSAARLSLAGFFIARGKIAEAMSLIRPVGDLSGEDRREMVTTLLAAGQYAGAYEVWAGGESESAGGGPLIADGGFEAGEIREDETFGWQRGHGAEAVNITLDTGEPRSGGRRLRLDWTGDSDPHTPVVSQLVPVEPNGRFQLAFAARTQDAVTGGRPVVVITDVSRDRRVLGESRVLPPDTQGWQDYTITFATDEKTSAVRIIIWREPCDAPAAPCPIFGRSWFDSFALRKL